MRKRTNNNFTLKLTQEQINAANALRLDAFFEAIGEPYRKKGSVFELTDKEGVIYNPTKNLWYSFYEEVGGTAVNYYMHFEHMAFPEAVLKIISDFLPELMNAEQLEYAPTIKKVEQPRRTGREVFIKKRVLKVPQKSDTNRHVFSYLTITRKIDPRVVNECFKRGILYEAKMSRGGRAYYNCAFVGYDEKGVIRNVALRGANPKLSWRGDAEGSEKEYAWKFISQTPTKTVAVYESGIEAMSHMTWEIQNGVFTAKHRVALNSISMLGLQKFLEMNPNTEEIETCLNNSSVGKNKVAGTKGTRKIFDLYAQSHIVRRNSPELKYEDWNDCICGAERNEYPIHTDLSVL